MSVNFSPMEIGRRALNASQIGINVTGQNIANVNNPAYSRRQVQLVESAHSTLDGRTVGDGVTVANVKAFRDYFIQSRIQTETGIAGRLTAQQNSLTPVEAAMQGGENGGLGNALTKFFGAFRDLEAEPGSVPLRAVAAQKGVDLANTFRSTRYALEETRKGTDMQLRSTVDQANTLATQIANLNHQIREIEQKHGDAEYLRDQRDQAITQIAELTGARSTDNQDGTFTISIGEGRPLVTGDHAYTLATSNTPPLGLASVTLDGQPAVFDEGSIRGYQEAIQVTSDQIDALDGLAAAVADRVNTLHSAGTDLDGNTGIPFFDNSQPIDAANMQVSAAILANPRTIVASPLTQPGTSGTVAGQIANLLTDSNNTVGGKSGSFTTIYGQMQSDVAYQIGAASDGLETHAAIISQANAQRDAVSGVSLDEEAINLMQYQRAFEAAARFIRVADEMTQTVLSLAG